MTGREKKTYGYRERSEAKRAAFQAHVATMPLSERVYVEEAGMDERDDYGYGWCERGQRFETLRKDRRTGRANIIAAYYKHQLNAAFTLDGDCIELRSAKGVRAVFEPWLEKCLLPTLQLGQVVILEHLYSPWRSDCPSAGISRLPFVVLAPVCARPQSY